MSSLSSFFSVEGEAELKLEAMGSWENKRTTCMDQSGKLNLIPFRVESIR
jgi:hypothetical protein